ncbi:antiviral innate immune response receptor RIG-I-like isoform X3 [Mytilus californianus]|uniref:antiviral innate immune response receptor RIG-I-like isoform X3 n=1 Tax=Mytilus californianus TaxID=6549 RepID=UPI0022477DC3|nr:antiviral innate immune response receptor RIG-I-like isoform X3 [Mytilus californianus]
MVGVFIPFLAKIIKAGELISSPKIKRILGDDEVKRLRKSKFTEEKKVQDILDIVDQSDNWETLIEVLKQDLDFTFVPEVLLKQYDPTVDTQLRNIVGVLFEESIETKPLSEALKSHDLLTDQDVQDISTECYNREEKAALVVLIDRVVKPHPHSWFKEFLDCMIGIGMAEIARKIDPDIKGSGGYSADVDIDDHWRKLIMELCHGQIVKNVTPSGLLTNLGSVFSMEEKGSIRSLERMDSPQSAMEKLLEMLDKKDYEGKWQIFKQALIEDDYEWVNDFIEGNFVNYEDAPAWELLINLFERTLSETIRPQEILPYLKEKSIISEKDSQEVDNMSRMYGENEAVFRLLTYLPKRKPKDWYPEFMQILYENGSAHVVKEIDPEKFEKLQARNCVLSDNIDVDETTEPFEGDMSNIEYDTKENYMSVTEPPQISSDNLSAPQTVNRVTYQPVSNFNLDQDDDITKEKLLAKKKDDEKYNKLSEEDSESQPESGRLELDSLFVENVKRDIAMEVCPEKMSNILGSPYDAVGNDDQDSDTDNEIVKEELRLRGYQMELAEPALDHKNCIIVAPTGSGKTYVALKIIQDHMEKTIDRFPKVVFLVEQSALAKQQADSCKKYLSKFRVKLITGEIQRDSKIQKSLSSWLDKKDILVVTAQLVVDALKNDEIKVEDFTLMVFDECHNANASHPYAQIMNEYMDLKLDESVDRQKLPFVVGLTASVGVGRANLEDENKYIQKMMANLDAEELSTVKKCLPELTEHAIVVEQETISTVERKKNYFGETLVVMMDTIESYMRNSSYASLLPDNGSILKGPTDKGSDTYTKWISKLLRETAKINRQDARRYFETCRLYLDLYNKVLTIYEDARVEDAILYLEQYLKRINEELKPDATDDKMLKIYQEGNRILAACVGNVYHINPKLIALRDIIFKLYKEKPDSRMIIFIKTREVVQAIENWMKDTDGLSYLNPVKFVCTHATGEKGGMTKMEQDGILKKFRTGKHKIILATSVAEEGLDIQTCNLIIRYDHAPNEIAIIQARGRNRAEGSKMVAVASEKRISVEKEEINLISETKMNDAILKVQQKLSRNKVQFLEDVEKIQRSEKKKRDLEKLSRKIGTKQRNSEFVLRCGKCSRYICISSDIKKIQNIHHAVINDDVRNSITTEKSETKRIRIDAYTTCVVGKVKCKNCEKELGNVIIHQGAEFPILKIDKLLVADSAGKTTVFKKWKSVPFCPDPMINEDLEFRLQGQPYVLD